MTKRQRNSSLPTQQVHHCNKLQCRRTKQQKLHWQCGAQVRGLFSTEIFNHTCTVNDAEYIFPLTRTHLPWNQRAGKKRKQEQKKKKRRRMNMKNQYMKKKPKERRRGRDLTCEQDCCSGKQAHPGQCNLVGGALYSPLYGTPLGFKLM